MTRADLALVKAVASRLEDSERAALCALIDHVGALERCVEVVKLCAENITESAGKLPAPVTIA